jgi:hypothetical protein
MEAVHPSEMLEQTFTAWCTNPKKLPLFEKLARNLRT